MATSFDERVDRAVAAVLAATTAPDVLRTASRQFVELLDAAAASISRLVGELLIEVAEFTLDDRTLILGQGYLVPDYPLTQQALERDALRTASLLDPDPDPQEAAVLRELGFDSLLMAPLSVGGERWGLAEIYANERRFADDEVAVAGSLAHVVGERLEELSRGGAPGIVKRP